MNRSGSQPDGACPSSQTNMFNLENDTGFSPSQRLLNPQIYFEGGVPYNMQHVQSPNIQSMNNSSANLLHQQQLQQQFNCYCNYAGGPLLQNMPHGVPMLAPGGFIMGQAPGVPYYTAAGFHQQVYSFQDTQFSHLPTAGYYDMGYQSPNSFSTDSNGNVSLAYATGTGALFSRNENGYPVPSMPSLNAAQSHGGIFITPTIATVIPFPPVNAYYNSDQFGAPAALYPESGHSANNAAQGQSQGQTSESAGVTAEDYQEPTEKRNERKRRSSFKKKNAMERGVPQINHNLEADPLQSDGQYDVNSRPAPHSSNGKVLSGGDDNNGENPSRKMKSDPEDESYIDFNDSWPPLDRLTLSIKEMSEQQSVQDSSTMGPLELTCTRNVPVSSVENNNSILKIPYRSSQEKQQYRPGPASSKKKVPTTGFLAYEISPSWDTSVKEPKQETLDEAAATRCETPPLASPVEDSISSSEDGSFESQSSRYQKRKLIEEEHYRETDSENPSLVIPPKPHKKKKLIKVTDFVNAPTSLQQHSQMVDTSDNRPGDLSVSKCKMLHELEFFEKALEFEEGIFPDSQQTSNSQLNNQYSMLTLSGRISPLTTHQQIKCSSKCHSALNPLISTVPVEETILEEPYKLTSQTIFLPNSKHGLEQNLKEEFHDSGSSDHSILCHQSVKPRKESLDGVIDESICTNVPIPSIEGNNSTPEIPYQLDSSQNKQHYRPGPASSKKKVATSDSSLVKVTQETSNEAATSRHQTPFRLVRLSSFIPAFDMSTSSLYGDEKSIIPPVKSGTGHKDQNQAYVRKLRSASISYRKTYPFEPYQKKPKKKKAGTVNRSISSGNQHVTKSRNTDLYTNIKEQPLSQRPLRNTSKEELTGQMDNESYQLAIDILKNENSDARRKSVQIAMDPRMTENPIKERDQMGINFPNAAPDSSPDFTNGEVSPIDDFLQSTIEIVKEDIDSLALENNNDWITLYLSQENGHVTTTAESINPTVPIKYETLVENDFNSASVQMEDDRYSADLIPTPSSFEEMRARSTVRGAMLLNVKKFYSNKATSYISQDREFSATPTTSRWFVAETPTDDQGIKYLNLNR